MAIYRNWIGYDSRGPATLRNVRRDITGEPLVLMDEGETVKLVLDLTQWLNGETIASVAATASGVTCTASTSGAEVTLTLSAPTAYDTSGKVDVTFTLSGGEVHKDTIRVRRINRFGDERPVADYT